MEKFFQVNLRGDLRGTQVLSLLEIQASFICRLHSFSATVLDQHAVVVLLDCSFLGRKRTMGLASSQELNINNGKKDTVILRVNKVCLKASSSFWKIENPKMSYNVSSEKIGNFLICMG